MTTVTINDPSDLHPWFQRVVTRDTDGFLLSQQITYDDGRIQFVSYSAGSVVSRTWTDPSDQWGWTSRSLTFDAVSGYKTTQTLTRDDGSDVTTTFVDSKVSTRSTQDSGNVQSWSSKLDTFDASGRIASTTTRFDDGRLSSIGYQDGVLASRTDTDALDAFNWSTKVFSYDANGRVVDVTTTRDDGVVVVTTPAAGPASSTVVRTDTADVFNWNEIRISYDASGDIAQRVVVNDDGQESTTQYVNGQRSQTTLLDLNDVDGLTSRVTTYLADGRVAAVTTTYDDGRVADKSFGNGVAATLTITDHGDNYVWGTCTTTFGVDGVISQQQQTFDDGRVQVTDFAAGLRDHAIWSDPLNAYGWSSIQQTFGSNGALLFSEFAFDDGRLAFRDARGQDIVGGQISGGVTEDSAATLETSGSLSINATFQGNQSFVAQDGTAGSNGHGTFFLLANGDWRYEADNSQGAIDALPAGATLTDSFVALTPDGVAQTVTVTITGANDAPVVAPLMATTDETQTAFDIALLASASDVDTGDMLSVENLAEDATNFGGFTLSGATLTYDASAFEGLAAGESQIINFTYDVVDTNGGRTANALELTVEGRDPAFEAADDDFSTDEDTSFSGDVSTNDEPNGGVYSVVSGPDGDLTLNADGSFDYEPGAFFAGLADGDTATDSFTYQIDTGSDVTQATVTIEISGLNDGPTQVAPRVVDVRLVTEDQTETQGGNGHSLAPSISADGDSISYDSSASDLISGDTNARTDVYVEDASETNSRANVQNGTNAQTITDGASGAALSADGGVVVFQSRASDLVPMDGDGDPVPNNNRIDIYVRDVVSGGTALLIQDGVDGQRLDGNSQNASVSADGRFVVFQSNATNLVTAVDDNSSGGSSLDDIFLHDRQTGETVMISQDVGTVEAAAAFNPSISADGKTVVFLTANSFDVADTNGLVDIYAYDVALGGLTLVSQSTGGVVGNQDAISFTGGQAVSTPSVSANGRFVTWVSRADNLVAGDTNNSDDVFVHDLETGETSRVSVSSTGVEGDGASFDAQISDNGRFVAFESQATNLDGVTPDTNGANDIFVHDRLTGETIRVSVTPDLANEPAGSQPDISADGSHVVFSSATVAANFDDRVTTGNVSDIYVAEIDTSGFALTANAAQLLIDLRNDWTDVDGGDLDFANITVTTDDPTLGRAITFTEVVDGAGNVTGITLDPAQFVSLGQYDTELLSVSYDVSDGIDTVSGVSGVAVNGVNDAPVGVDGTFDVNQGTTLNGSFMATDADGDALNFANLSTGLSGSLTVLENGSFSYTAGAGQTVGDVVSIGVFDDAGGITTLTATFDVNVAPTFTAPAAVQVALTQEIDPNAANAIDISAFFDDAAGSSLTYDAVIAGQSALPSGLRIDSATGIISGTPTTNEVVRIAVTATDAGGLATTGAFWLGIVDGTLTGGATAEVLTDDGFSRLVDGQAGNDSLFGGDQADIFVHRLGDGLDIIDETGLSDTDHLVLVGYASTDVVFERLSANPFEQKGLDLLIRPAAGDFDFSQGVIVRNGLGTEGSTRRISEYHFDDGVTLTDTEVRALILAGETTSGMDDIRGFGGADTLDGGAGDDVLRGGDGSDLYIYEAGNGHDTIRETGRLDTDIVQIGYDIGDASFAQGAGSDDLLIDFGGGDALTLINTINGSVVDGIETLRFADGDLSMADVRNILTEQQATSGDDVVIGFDRSETLDGKAGNDTLVGGDGADTYVYRAGGGDDVVLDQGAGDYDNLTVFDFTIDYDHVDGVINPGSQVTFARSADVEAHFVTDDLVVLLDDGAGATGQVTLIDALTGDPQNGIEGLIFDASGVTLTMAQVRSDLIAQQQTAGDDLVYGFSTGDTIVGGTGNDTLTGRDGLDIYVFSAGDGHDVVADMGNGDNDRVQFTDRNLADFTITYGLGDDKTIIFEAGSDRIEVIGALGGGTLNNIAFFDFADQTLTELEMRQHVVDQALTQGRDLIGADGSQFMPSSPGSDRFISGGEGSDTYSYVVGDGNDRILDGGSGSGDIIDVTGFTSTDFALAGPHSIRFDPAFSGDVQLFIDANNTLDILAMADFEQIQFADVTFDNDADDLDGATNFEAFIASLVAEAVAADPNEDVITKVAVADPGGNNTFTSTAANEHFALDNSSDDQLIFNVGQIGDDSVTKTIATTGGYDITIDFSGIVADNVLQQDVILRASEVNSEDVIIDIIYEDTAFIDPVQGIGRVEETITLIGALAQFSGVDSITIIDNSGSTSGFASTTEVQQFLVDQQVTSGDDIIAGYVGSLTLRGGGGHDILVGNRGGDTYEYGSSDGNVVIAEGSFTSGTDVLRVLDYALADASLSRSPIDPDDLVLDFGGGDVLTIRDFGQTFRLEQIVFNADSAIPESSTFAEVSSAYLSQQRSTGDDILIGMAALNETLEGGLGNDLLDGGEGSDTYIVRRGEGDHEIRDTGIGDTDAIFFDVTSTSVTFVQDRIDPADFHIVMDDGTAIKVVNFANGGIEQFVFTDATLSAEDARTQAYDDIATTGDDLIIGGDAVDNLRGGLGDDVVSGGSGADVFHYVFGDGDDTLLANASASRFELIQISGVSLLDLRVESVPGSRDLANGTPSNDQDMLISFASGAGSILVQNGLSANDSTVLVRLDDDGTMLTTAELTLMALEADIAAGRTILEGPATGGTVFGNGATFILSDQGDDTFAFAAGDGTLTILDDAPQSGTNRLEITGYSSTDATLDRLAAGSEDFVIRLPNGDQIVALGDFDANPINGVNEIFFAGDGVTLDDAAITTVLDG